MGRPAIDRAVVTGGGGFLGGAIARRLVAEGTTVVSFSRGRYPELDALSVRQIQGDLADANAVAAACQDVSAVFHTAAKPGVWGARDDFFRPNVLGTRHVIAACRQTGVRALIHTSSPSVVFDGADMEGIDESTPYPARFHAFYPETKALAEQDVIRAARNGLTAVALRPHLIWGPRDNHLVPRIIQRARRLRIVGDGDNMVDTTYIDNAAHAHLLAAKALLEQPDLSGRVYFISDGAPVNLWEMVNAILAAGGKPPVTRRISAAAARRMGAALEFIYKTLRLPGEPPMTRFVAEELATAHWFDIGAAERDFGYRPVVSMEEGLKRLADWLQSRS